MVCVKRLKLGLGADKLYDLNLTAATAILYTSTDWAFSSGSKPPLIPVLEPGLRVWDKRSRIISPGFLARERACAMQKSLLCT